MKKWQRRSVGAFLLILTLGYASYSYLYAEYFHPVSNEKFVQIKELYQYDPSVPLNAKTLDVWDHRNPYIIERIRYESTNQQNIPGYFVYPKNENSEKCAAVLLIHGHNSFWGKNEDWTLDWLDILARSGRCVLAIDNLGYGDRINQDGNHWWKLGPEAERDVVIQSVIDLRRGLDYLQTRPEVDPKKIGLLGGSWGGHYGVLVSGLDERLSAVVLIVTSANGWQTDDPVKSVESAINFAPHIMAPVLMVNATGDGKRRAEALYDQIPDPKKIVWYESDHFLPPKDSHTEAIEWFDTYLKR